MRKNTTDLTDHVCKQMNALVEKRMELIPTEEGSDWRDLPNIVTKLSDGTYSQKLIYSYNDAIQGKGKNGALRGVCHCMTGKGKKPEIKESSVEKNGTSSEKNGGSDEKEKSVAPDEVVVKKRSSRSRSRSRKRSRSREKKKRSRSRSREKRRSRSRDRKARRSTSRDRRRKRSRSRDRTSKRRERSRSRERTSKSSSVKVTRDYDKEDAGFEGSKEKSAAPEDTPKKEILETEDMEISNSP